MNRKELAERKLEVMNEAAQRWRANAPETARVMERLARGGPRAATGSERTAYFVAREAIKGTLLTGDIRLERKIGPTLDFDDFPPDEAARKAGRPVARIVELLSTARIGEGFATGFVVAPGLLVTNWHVFANSADAKGCGAQFGFERNVAGLLESGVVFELDPAAFFLSDKGLDIAIVGLKPAAAIGQGPLQAQGSVKLIPTPGKILVGHPVSIIQHPDGQYKHWAVRQNKLLLDPGGADLFLTYMTDTLAGSSGSPAFNHDWELIAVHHSGVPRQVNGQIVTRQGTIWKPGMPDTEIDWIANEGARVSKICAYLQQLKLPSPSHQAILDQLVGGVSDPVLASPASPPPKLPAETLSTETATRSEGSMNVIVNGTANFFLGPDPNKAAAAEFVPPAAAAIVAKPGVGQEKKLKFDSDYTHRPGYDSKFLPGFDVPVPLAPAGEVLKEGNQVRVLKYHHYSLVMHKKRRLVMWSAANVDYSESKRWRSRDDFGEDTWKPDPRIAIETQIEDLEFYEPAAKFDRGHIVRRDDVAWGDTKKEEEFGNSDSFHWTNCTPQHEGFNRDAFGYKGIWGGLENHIAKQAGFLQNVLIVFAGPVLATSDPKRDFGSGIKVQVPIVFWKVVVAVEEVGGNRNLRAYGFLLDQTDAIEQYGWEARFKAGKFQEHQVGLAAITTRTRVTFKPLLHAADPLAHVPHESRQRRLQSLEDVTLR